MRTLFLQLSLKFLSTLGISHQYMKQMSSLPQRHRLFRQTEDLGTSQNIYQSLTHGCVEDGNLMLIITLPDKVS